MVVANAKWAHDSIGGFCPSPSATCRLGLPTGPSLLACIALPRHMKPRAHSALGAFVKPGGPAVRWKKAEAKALATVVVSVGSVKADHAAAGGKPEAAPDKDVQSP